jgi:hypothetical protein
LDLTKLLTPPEIEIACPAYEIEHEDLDSKFLALMAKNQQSDSLELYDLAIQAEQLRMETSLQRLLIAKTCVRAINLEHISENIRYMMRQLRGRVLLCHEPGISGAYDLAFAFCEYILRGSTQRALFLAPRELLGFWHAILHSILAQDIAVAEQWPTDTAWPPILLLACEALRFAPPPQSLHSEQYPLVAATHAEYFRQRRTNPWKAILQLSPRYLLFHTGMPFINNPAELHGLLALLDVPELPPPARLKNILGLPDTPISPITRQNIRPYLDPVVLRNTHTTHPLAWPTRQWHTHPVTPTKPCTELCTEIHQWLRLHTCAPPDNLSSFADYNPTSEQLSIAEQEALSPLLAATWSTTSAIYASLAHLSALHQFSRFQEQFSAWKQRAEESRLEEPRNNSLLSLIKENLYSDVVVFCRDHETCDMLAELLRQQLPESLDNQRLHLVSDRAPARIPPTVNSVDLLVHFDLPWSLELIDTRSHWLLPFSSQNRQIYILVNAKSEEWEFCNKLLFRLKPHQLAPEEMSIISQMLPAIWQSPHIHWQLLHSPSPANEFFELFSQQLLEARKSYRQIHDQNQRLFLDDYAL